MGGGREEEEDATGVLYSKRVPNQGRVGNNSNNNNTCYAYYDYYYDNNDPTTAATTTTTATTTAAVTHYNYQYKSTCKAGPLSIARAKHVTST